MLASFSALNEVTNSEISESSTDVSEEIPEFDDDDFLVKYNDALTRYGRDDFESAERKFRNLLESEYFKQCGYESQKPRPIAVKLQYNSYRHLGLCLGNQESYEECLDCLQNAINIDGTDRTLYFKLAVFATKFGKYHLARSALEASLSLDFGKGEERVFPNVRHWPTVDLLISLTYKIGDFISALKYIHLALSDDPAYDRALKVRQLIYDENPWLNPDESKHNDVPIIHSVIVSQPKKVPEEVVSILTMSANSISEFGKCLNNEYTKHGPTGQILSLYSVKIVEQSKSKEVPQPCEEVIEDTTTEECLPESQLMEEDEITEIHSSEQIVRPIISDIISDLLNPTIEEFMQEIFFDIVDEAMAGLVENQGPPRRRGGVGSFLEEVPLDLIEKRRSARYKSCFNEAEEFLRCEEITAKSLLESYLPESLKNVDDHTLGELKQHEHGLSSFENREEILTVSESDESNLMSSILESTVLEKLSLLDGFSNFLLSVSEKFSLLWWPVHLCDIFLRCYLCWRKHYVPPEDEEHPYVNVIVLANEIILGEGFLREQTNETLAEDVPSNEFHDFMLEFIEKDLDHLKLHLFHVEREMAIRIFSLHIQFYKWQDMTSESLIITENMNDFLNNHCDRELRNPFSPIEPYQLIHRDNIDSFLESLKQHTMITKVSSLFAEKDYRKVQLILSAYLTKKKRKSTDQSQDYSLRAYHLSMMIESLWNLQSYAECLKWSEQGFHEAIEESKKKTEPEMVPQEAESSEEILDFLKMIECCLILQNGKFDGLDQRGRSRLSKNLLNMILVQVDESESSKLSVKTVLPWMVLYKLILSEESNVAEDPAHPRVPGSLEFLCSAHDYLGPQALCTIESGHLLRVLVDVTVKCLFKVKGQSQVEHLSKHLDQALYCLYAHPCKKSKLKHLIDHNAPTVAFTWDKCIPPYIYLRPEKLPEFDDFKSTSISTDTMTFYKRVVAVVPEDFDLEGREACLVKFLQTDADGFPRFKCQSKEEFPRHLIDVFYLLADYFFKNNEFPTAIKYYKIDLTFNNRRIDSWISFALALASGLEPKINETVKNSANVIERIKPETVKQIIAEGEETLRCFKACLRLSPRNSTIQIESANLTYMLSSFCLRLLSEDSETMSMEFFNRIDSLKKYFLDFAEDHYNVALNIFEDQTDDSTDSDERWLLHTMKGKIFHKRKLPIELSLREYLKALENLLAQGAGPLPKKISFNSPQEFSLEMLEVLYRIHSAILKDEFQEHEDLSDKRFKIFSDVLNKVDTMNLFVIESKSSKDELQSSEVNSTEEDPPEKKARLSEPEEGEVDEWRQISIRCQKALDNIVSRFPQHFKAMHCLAHYYLKSTLFRDLQKSLRYLWSNEGTILSANEQPIKINALFAEKKANNLFNGFWRYPISEFDRAGNFSAHVDKCTTTLLELASKLSDYKILLEVACQLKRPADCDRKYLFERDRLALEQRAQVLMREAVKSKLKAVLTKQCVDGEQDKLLEEKGNLMLDCYTAHGKIKRLYHAKDETFSKALIELYSHIIEKANPKLDEALNFCSKIVVMTNTGSKKGNQETQQVTASLIRSAKESLQPVPKVGSSLISPLKQSAIQRPFPGDVNAAALATLAASGSLKASEINQIYSEFMRMSMIKKAVSNPGVVTIEPVLSKSQSQSAPLKQSTEVLMRNKATGSVMKHLTNRFPHSPVAKKPSVNQKQALLIKQMAKQTLLTKQVASKTDAKTNSNLPPQPKLVSLAGSSNVSKATISRPAVNPNHPEKQALKSDASRVQKVSAPRDIEAMKKIALQKQMALKRLAEARKSLDSAKQVGQAQPSALKSSINKLGASATFSSTPNLSRPTLSGESVSIVKTNVKEAGPKIQQPSSTSGSLLKGQSSPGILQIPGVTLTKNPVPVSQVSLRPQIIRPNLSSGPSVQITSSSLTIRSVTSPMDSPKVRITPSLTISSVVPSNPTHQNVRMPITLDKGSVRNSVQLRPTLAVHTLPNRGPSPQSRQQNPPSRVSSAQQIFTHGNETPKSLATKVSMNMASVTLTRLPNLPVQQSRAQSYITPQPDRNVTPANRPPGNINLQVTPSSSQMQTKNTSSTVRYTNREPEKLSQPNASKSDKEDIIYID